MMDWAGIACAACDTCDDHHQECVVLPLDLQLSAHADVPHFGDPHPCDTCDHAHYAGALQQSAQADAPVLAMRAHVTHVT